MDSLQKILDIHIDWQGPFSLEQAKSNPGFGLYQYYGDHPVYGQGVLLYIGKTESTFAARLSQHNWETWIPAPTSVYLGHLCGPDDIPEDQWPDLVDMAENILIFAHSPTFNSSRMNTISSRNRDVRVLNWGNRKCLLPEVSISRWEGGQTVGHRRPSVFAPFSRKLVANSGVPDDSGSTAVEA